MRLLLGKSVAEKKESARGERQVLKVVEVEEER
jgi:hypothetical protein